MPSPRTTIFLGVLVLLASGHVFLLEPRLETTAERERFAGRVVRLTADEVERIEIRRDAWTSAVVERVDPVQFRTVEPQEGAVDGAQVARLLSALEFLESRALLLGDGADEARRYEYGLLPPRLAVALGLADGREVRLSLGKEVPLGGDVYLHLHEQRSVHVVGQEIRDLLEGLLDALGGAPSAEPQGDSN